MKGEKAADWLFAASGVPHPFQRSRRGSAPSFHASRTASAQGSIWLATSFKYGLYEGPVPSEAHGVVSVT